ncbi:M20/M25/M40 family metallo-hydrolase, partial [Salmonella enterica]|uniref:M20/M25/M40 family metallo-hydrolase n=1 Tax=Salmonella enterica TaxID=28901 RepID=UPI000CA64E9F
EMNNIGNLLHLRTADDHPLIHKTQNAIKEITNEDKELTILTGGSDGSQFVRANPEMAVIIIGPGDFGIAHQPNEFVKINDFYDAISIYEQVAIDYLS